MVIVGINTTWVWQCGALPPWPSPHKLTWAVGEIQRIKSFIVKVECFLLKKIFPFKYVLILLLINVAQIEDKTLLYKYFDLI